MENFAPYSHAIACLALWALMNVVLGMVATRGRTDAGRAPSGKPIRNYSDPVYRADRAHMNAMENSGPFIGAVVAAILAGAAPFWVNVFACVFLVARVAMAFVHIRTENQPMRSLFFVIGMVSILALVVMALRAVI